MKKHSTILFTTPVLEHPAAGGPQLRIENSIKALSQVSELHIISRVTRRNIGGLHAEDFYRGLCLSFCYSPSSYWFHNNRYMRFIRKLHIRLANFVLQHDVCFFLEKIDRLKIDVLWFGYGNISFTLMKAIRVARPKLKIVCDTDSVWSRFILRELPYVTDPQRRLAIEREGRQKQAEERAWVDFCDVTTAVSEVDAIYYRSIAQDPQRIQLFSNVIDLGNYQQLPPAPSNFRNPAMYLAGTFGHCSPMDMATQWIIDEILPRVQKVFPNIHFYIVGRNSDLSFGHIKHPSITVTGKLPSVLPYLSHSDVALVPLKFESGTRFKIMEAAACGIPIVSTVLGAEGIPVTDNEDILLADDADVFSDAVVRLITDKEFSQKISSNAIRLIRNISSIENLENEALSILKRLEND